MNIFFARWVLCFVYFDDDDDDDCKDKDAKNSCHLSAKKKRRRKRRMDCRVLYCCFRWWNLNGAYKSPQMKKKNHHLRVRACVLWVQGEVR